MNDYEDKLSLESVGTLELCKQWRFTPGKDEKCISSKQVTMMKQFFIDYKVIFAAVWEGKLQEDDVQDYFRGSLSLKELIETFEFYSECKGILDDISTVGQLEDIVRTYKLFDMND